MCNSIPICTVLHEQFEICVTGLSCAIVQYYWRFCYLWFLGADNCLRSLNRLELQEFLALAAWQCYEIVISNGRELHYLKGWWGNIIPGKSSARLRYPQPGTAHTLGRQWVFWAVFFSELCLLRTSSAWLETGSTRCKRCLIFKAQECILFMFSKEEKETTDLIR